MYKGKIFPHKYSMFNFNLYLDKMGFRGCSPEVLACQWGLWPYGHYSHYGDMVIVTIHAIVDRDR